MWIDAFHQLFWKVFGHHLSSTSFSLLSLWGSICTYVRQLDIVPQILDTLLFLLYALFSWWFILDNFYHFDLNFIYPLFSFAQSAGKSISLWYLSVQLCLLFFIIIIVSISLVKFAMSSFMLSHIFATVSFCIVIFESLSDNIKILAISTSVCIAGFFSWPWISTVPAQFR